MFDTYMRIQSELAKVLTNSKASFTSYLYFNILRKCLNFIMSRNQTYDLYTLSFVNLATSQFESLPINVN